MQTQTSEQTRRTEVNEGHVHGDGARRAREICCGYGTSTVLLAKAYPRSLLIGCDTHPASIDAARGNAERSGLADRVRFEVASAMKGIR